jgi:hypothetical protein
VHRFERDEDLPPVDDDTMRAALATARPYTVAILRRGPRRDHPERDRLVWEHGRRNFRLRAAGLLAVVLPFGDGADTAAVGVFDLDLEGTRAALEGDPAIRAGVFTLELHPARGFPGDRLPGNG